jgi:2-polyprenyl-3-methyl-5-hydroxy-6-metoxy-1,4-benzoquinol methylase
MQLMDAPHTSASSSHADEVAAGERFAFGDNWRRFLADLDDTRIAAAEKSLRQMLGVQDLKGRRFLDIGSGSGLFSLAARRLGATVHSFDFDPSSVACAETLKQRYFPNDEAWTVEQGSALDTGYLQRLGAHDVVYSWGVLHHKGHMWQALEAVAACVAPSGQLFVAIYNDQGFVSRYWTVVKQVFNRGLVGRWVMIVLHWPYLFALRWLVRASTGRLPLERGMSLWRDVLDWLGGYPFEVAKPEAIFQFYRDRGFSLQALVTCGSRMGCNEFVFRRLPTEGLSPKG